MTILKWLLPPLIGALIGYVTNHIAIRMLFRPHNAVYVGKWRLPFTPGLIPKERQRIASSIGRVVGSQLLTNDVILKTLTSPEMVLKLKANIEKIIEDNRHNDETVEATLQRFMQEESYQKFSAELLENLVNVVHNKLTSDEFISRAKETVLASINKRSSSKTSFVSALIDKGIMMTLSKSLGDLINNLIADNSREILQSLFDAELENLKNVQISTIVEKFEGKLYEASEFILREYENVIKTALPHVMETVDIGKVVENRIADFDVLQFEDMIFGIMRKELKAIEYLGALLGFIMGCVNLLVRF